MIPSPQALIVDDDPSIIQTVGDIVRSLDHDADTASDIASAKQLLAAKRYDYLILDMKIPVSPERKFGRRENGRNLIQTLRGNPDTVELPIIVITGEDSGESDFILSVIRVGGMDYTEYIQKPIDGDKLDCAIQRLIARRAGGGRDPVQLRPFIDGDELRILEIYPERATLCGVQVWTDCAYPEIGQILRWLTERNSSGTYVRLTGKVLCERLERDASNPVGQPIKRFRESCREQMAACMALDCDLYDVIGPTRGGGYHLTSTIDARIVDESGTPLPPAASVAAGDDTVTIPGLNDRQIWVLEQIDQGAEPRQKTVVDHFRRDWSASQIKRDLKDLRDRDLIRTSRRGIYERIEKEATHG